MREYCCPVVELMTREGRRLAAGCICLSEYAEECERRLRMLEDYTVGSRDLVEIDFELAEAVSRILSFKEDSPVIAAGCSIHVEPVAFPDYMTTGGILGDPCEETESSTEETEKLRDGFSMLTLPGSPGLAADADEKTVEKALYRIRMLRDDGHLTKESLDRVFREFGFHTALLVFDGTGKTAHLTLAAYDCGNTIFVS